MTSTCLSFTCRDQHRSWLGSQAALPRGFRVGTSSFWFVPRELGTTRAKMTLTLIALERPSADFALVFTQNAFPGAPVRIGRRRLLEPALSAILVNNKISNVCAPGGEVAAETLCVELSRWLKIPATSVLPCSTGVIGWMLPVEPMVAALPQAVASLSAASGLAAAEGIMTTDLYPKVRRRDLWAGSIVGIAKGAGMIEPNLATLLVYLLTDLAVPRDVLREMLPRAVEPSFNSMSIDHDSSTSDTVALVSSGQVPGTDWAAFEAGLRQVCCELAEDVVRS